MVSMYVLIYTHIMYRMCSTGLYRNIRHLWKQKHTQTQTKCVSTHNTKHVPRPVNVFAHNLFCFTHTPKQLFRAGLYLNICHLFFETPTNVFPRTHVTYECVMSHIWMNHVTYEWVMSHMNESCHVNQCVSTHTKVFQHHQMCMRTISWDCEKHIWLCWNTLVCVEETIFCKRDL